MPDEDQGADYHPPGAWLPAGAEVSDADLTVWKLHPALVAGGGAGRSRS